MEELSPIGITFERTAWLKISLEYAFTVSISSKEIPPAALSNAGSLGTLA